MKRLCKYHVCGAHYAHVLGVNASLNTINSHVYIPMNTVTKAVGVQVDMDIRALSFKSQVYFGGARGKRRGKKCR